MRRTLTRMASSAHSAESTCSIYSSARISHGMSAEVPLRLHSEICLLQRSSGQFGKERTDGHLVDMCLMQFWRLISRNLAFTNSIDLLISILLLYRASVLLEQRYGTAKFVVRKSMPHCRRCLMNLQSFAMVSSTMGTALEMLALFAGHRFGLK